MSTGASQLFAEVYGAPPTGAWSAPGRVNLLGEHTDYNKGLRLPVALRQRAVVAARLGEVDVLRAVSMQSGSIVEVPIEGIAPGNLTEIQRVRAAVAAISARDFTAMGDIFVASHASLRDDFEVSTTELDTAVDAAMSGGGFGGSVVALVRADTEDAVVGAVTTAFSGRCFSAPECFAVAPSGQAGRDR
ncbi:galactokinase family protein [Phycicoccus sp. Soil802]|uniref:galactokinase family protein n=1 Tax=Phycicoccus sp. Soil802 TaxID=1736414 RepID=UPI000702B102|nr:galactokinase family protein [Phycicoccus sp. Soil802]KRF22338.1 hypothetical protein ASG91_18665 [Phycicoccus sp. Soil802]